MEKTVRKFEQNKLWRDQTPQIMEQQHGSIIHVKYLSDVEYEKELRTKLLEEAMEVKESLSRDELISEIADLQEVLSCIMKLHNISAKEVENFQEQKRQKLGSFEKRQYVTIAEHPVGSFGEQYCLKNPTKYPEVF